MATKKKAAPQRAYSIQDLINEGIAYTPESTEPTAAADPQTRTWGQAVGDTAVQLAEGVNTTLGAIPSIVAPDSSMAGFFRDNADYWRDKQSDVLKKRIAATDQRIQEAGKEGVMSQIGAAASEYWNDPAQAARLVATNVPSMAATLGTGMLAGATAKGVAAARGLDAANKAALAAQYGTRTAMATNAALNAGGARGEAYEDLKRAALAQGMSAEQAEQVALEGSIMPGVVGGVAGAVSGKLGLEKALLGQTGAGAGTALRRAAGSFGAELAGEQIEEVAPKLTTNYEAGKIDPTRSLTDDLGRTMVETAIGAGPGAIVAGGVEGMSTPAQAAADTIRATEKVPESGALTKAVNAGVEAKAQAVEAGAPVPTQPGADQSAEAAPEPVDDPVRDQILALPDGARQDALRAYAVVNRTDVAKGVQQYNRKLLDRLLSENAPPPVLGERLTDTDMGSMLGGGGMAGRADPLAGALGMNNEAQANSITNVANVAERRPPMPASDAARMLDEARARGLDLAVAEHPAGGFVLIPPNWVTPDMAAQGEARLKETIARMQQADAAPVERAPRTRTDGVGLNLQTDPVQNYLDNLRGVNTPAARAYVRDFDAGRITPADVQQRMQAERGLTPEQRIARAAAEAPAQVDTVAERLRSAAAQGMATPAPTDILNPSGEPFKTKMAADRAAKKSPGAAVLPVVDGGFLVRPKESVSVQDVPQAPEVSQAAPVVSPPGQAPQAVGTQPAGPAAGVPAEGAGAVEAAGVEDSPSTAPTIVEVQDNYGRTHRVRQSDLYSNADRIPTVRKNGEVVAGEEIPRSIVKDAPSVAEPPPIDPLGWNAKKLASTYDMAQMQDLYQYVLRNYSNPVVGGGPVENGKATTERFNAEGREIHKALQQAQTAIYERSKAQRAQDGQTAAPMQPGGNQPAAQAAPAAGAQAATAAEPEFTTIKTVNGDSVTVRAADLNSDKPRLRQYTKDGKSKAVPAIHRDNLDQTGEKQAAANTENANNPMFDVVTRNGGEPFASKVAAAREQKRRGLTDSHEVVEASVVSPNASGFVVKRKAVAPVNQPEAPNSGAQRAAAPQAEAAQPATPQQEGNEFLPEGWTKSVNGYTKRPVYRMEQGVGQPFAVVTQTEGMTYEVQIRHGDKQLTAGTQRGALSEVLAAAEADLGRMTQADSVTHADPGEKAEAATPAVVTDSLKKAARNEDTKPSEMRKWLVAEIDKELLQAPDRADYDEAVKRLGEKDAISMFTGNGRLGKNSETGFITFDVPGDGKYKVRNSVRGLLEFRKNVMASQGFKDSGQKRVKPEQNDGVHGGSGGNMAAITNMVEEGDFEAARDYAEAVGVKLEDVKVPRGENAHAWKMFLSTGKVPEQKPVSREWTITNEQNPNGTWSRVAKLKRKADGVEYEATVTGSLDNTRATYVLTKDGKEYSRMTSGQPFSTAIELAENAMPAANDKPAPSKASDTGWNLAGNGYAGKRYIGRNITLDDGREVVARVYENAGTYEEAEVKVDGVRKFTVTDRDNAQGKADAFIKTLTATGEKITYKLATPDKMTPRQFDDWIRQRATIQTEQFRGDRNHGGGDEGVGYIHLSGKVEAGGTNWAGTARGNQDKRDTRLIFRTDDNKIVWYDDASQQVYEVLKDDARLEITRPEPTPKQARDPQEITVTVDGSDYTVTFDEPLATISNQAFQDNLDEYGTPGVAKAEFRKLRAQAQAGEKRFDVPKPPTWDYRLKQRGGSTYLIPPVGQAFTPETRRALRDWARDAGYSASIITDNEISVAAVTDGPPLDYIVDGVKEQAYGRQADKERAAAPAPEAPSGTRRDPTKVSMFNPYNDGDIVTIGGQDWTVKQDTPGWYLTNTGNWRGQHPTIRNVKAMADLIRAVEQAAVAQPAKAQPEAPKLTPAEAKSLMAWEDLGQKDGVKTHALTFYESQADKDAKRGRMIVAKVSKGDRSATAWMVDGEDKTFGALSLAKKLAEEVGMAKAVADGFVEPAAEKPAAAKPAPAKPAAAPQPEAPAAPITDFGEKIGGARKDVWSGFKDDLNKVLDDDIAGQPLTKVWPAPDYQKLIDAGMNAKTVAAVRALRDEVPAKPRAAWKVKRWAEQVKTLRGLANDVMDGKITVQDMERMGANKGTSLRGMMGRIELYELVGHEKSLEGVRFAHHYYTLYKGRENVSLWVVEKDAGASAFSNWPREIAVGDTKEQALAAFKEKYAGLDLEKAVRKAEFVIFSERGSNAFYVGKKIGRNYAKLEGPFNTVREAREYREKNLAALEAKLEKYKEIPRERADVNQPRVGVDMRNGQDVTPQMFGEVFGFRGVEFGNWVEQKRRQKDLNDAFDALMDMAAVLDIPPKAISLNGELGLAFGARGSGGVHPAAAHYEPDNVVINLTKKEGAGSLGHEWWHALDNYFAKQRKVNRGSFMTTGTDVGLAARGKDYYYEGGIRQEMIDAFGAVVKAINQTAMKARASTLDGKRTKDYWTTGEEMSARAFESYLISKLQDQNASNDYLANVVSEETWNAMAALGMENENSYPYPTAAEIPAIRAGFDHFFQTVETRETEGGNVAMFSRSPSTKSAYEARIDALFAGEKAGAGTRVLDRSDMMGFLGFQNAPLLLDERHLLDNQTSHPEMTAEQWKKVPQWLDNPVVAYEDRGRIVMIAPETVAGYPVRMVIEPSPTAAKRGQAESFQLLVTVFAKTTQPHVPNLQALADSGSLRYLDTKTAPEIWKRAGAKFPRQVSDLRSRTKILTEKQFDGYRRANNPAAFMGQPTPPADSNARNVATQLLVDGLKSKWTRAPEIIVARNMQDAQIPQEVRDYDALLKSQGATGEPRGFIYQGKVYLLSDQLKGPQQIAEVLFHEVLGHYGLRGAFGDGLTPILKQLGALRRKEVVAKAREYGLFNKDALGGLDKAAASDSQIWAAMSAKNRLSAAEEVLAEMAQTQPTIGFVQRAIAAIRNWLRANVPGFKNLKLTDADIVQAYILPARGYVTRSNETAQQAIDRAMADAGFSRTAGDQTHTENFRRWFGDSKVVDSDGKPLVVYHGSSRDDITAFDPERTGSASDAGYFGTGVYFAEDAAQATAYGGENATTYPVYLSIKNPYVWKMPVGHRLAEAIKLWGWKGIGPALRGRGAFGGSSYANNVLSMVMIGKKLPPEIHEAVIRRAGMTEAEVVGLYDPGAMYKRGEYVNSSDAQAMANPLIRKLGDALRAELESRGYDGIVVDNPKADGKRYREYVAFRPEQVKSAIGNNGNFDPTNPDIRFSRTTEAAKAVGDTLKSITVSNVKERAGFKLTDYLGIGLQTLGRRQIVDIYGDMLPLAEYNRLVQQMEADKNEGGAEADQLVTRWAKLEDEGKLADLMHDATLAQIDPAEDFVEGDDKGKYLMLQRKYNLLSDEAKKVYADTRDAYKAHHAKVRSAIKERIERSEIKGERKAALLKQMDDEFFKAIKGVYFPLARFGQYAVTVKGPDGKVESVSRAETKAEAEALRNNLLSAFPRDKGFTVGRVMLSKDFIADRDAVGRGFMTELYQVLDKQDMDATQRAELEDTLGQLYLSSLPDLSWAKHGIHRKGTPGFSQDARRAFAQNMFHGARYLAKLRYSDLMQDELAAMQKHVDDWREVEDFDQNSAQRVVDEMNKRHESLMNPKSNPLSTALTSLGFVFHLGLSPASAMVNLSQTALVAYPIMGAKWGFGKASAALLKASAEAAKGKNDITGSLNADELAAYNEAVRAGTIDVTMAHDLAGIAQGEDAGVMWKIRPVMRWASFLFHHAERFNRQVTFVAAYRLAREAGADQKAAFEQATKATYDGHYDYSAANRPRIMQGNVAKVLLLFKQYGQNMVYTLARNAQQAIKGESPEARAQARKALGGLLATHAMAAGVLGLPMVTTLLAAASMIGGDDDEPWDAKVALQNMLADTLGQKPAEVLAHGLSRLTPWDISGRVGLDKLIFPDVQEGLEGQRLGEAAMAAALGPVAGIGINVLKGLQDMSQGQYARGLEAMMPAALRGPVKAIRYESEGVQDKTGVVIKDDVSLAGVAGQFLGFSPSEVRNATEGKSAVIQQDRALGERRQELLTKAARATMAKDAEARAEAMKEIERFNQKNPTRRITPPNVLQSVRNRQKRIDQAEGGVYLPKNRRDAMEAGRFAVAE